MNFNKIRVGGEDMIEIKVPDEPQGDYISRQAVYELIGTLKMGDVRAMEKLRRGLEKLPSEEGYNKGYADGVEAYKAMMELEKEEPAEWIVDTDDSRRWDRVRFYCSACNSWNTYGKSKYCPNCGRRMQSEGLQREDS